MNDEGRAKLADAGWFTGNGSVASSSAWQNISLSIRDGLVQKVTCRLDTSRTFSEEILFWVNFQISGGFCGLSSFKSSDLESGVTDD